MSTPSVEKFKSFIDSWFEQEPYFAKIADDVENNPLLAIDYLRRAYLISGNNQHKEKIKQLATEANFKGRARNSVEMLLAEFDG